MLPMCVRAAKNALHEDAWSLQLELGFELPCKKPGIIPESFNPKTLKRFNILYVYTLAASCKRKTAEIIVIRIMDS